MFQSDRSKTFFISGRYRRALPPPYLSVDGHQRCLATFQASATHTERCLPLKPLTECPVETWAELQAVLAEGKPVQKKKIAARAVQPSYLSVEGHQLCLGDFQASETHREKCLPLQKPLECSQEAWDLLVVEFKDSSCPPELVGGLAGLPPAYLTVNGYQDCLLTEQSSETHQGYCLPDAKPDDCEQESFEELKNVFQGPSCPVQRKSFRQLNAGPPAYLSVPLFEKCLGEQQKPGDTHIERCLPPAQPSECPKPSWDQISVVFDGDKCKEARTGRQSGPPKYLSVPNFKLCLGEHQKPGNTHTERCLPKQKPANCPQASWDSLVEVFVGDKCNEQQRESPHIVGLGAPEYLSVPDFHLCLGDHQRPGATFTERCLPIEKPVNCPKASWDSLVKVFTGDKCLQEQRKSRQVGVGAPPYLSVPNFKDCLEEHQKPGDTHIERCLPANKPNACPIASWEKLVEVFTGDKCLQQQKGSRQIGHGGPAYLSVPNFQLCLGEHQKPGDTHTERCLPKEKPANCPVSSWLSLVEVFVGDKCLEQPSETHPVIGLGAPEYLSVPNFHLCLDQHQRPDATFTERCLPTAKPDDCPQASWDNLVEVFTGDKCLQEQRESRQVGAGPPAYLTVPNFKECLGEHQKPGDSHTERCLPKEKPANCPTTSWESLTNVFVGDNCLEQQRESRQAIGLGAPEYLSVPNFQLCLGEHKKPGDTHTERCLPAVKPDDCPTASWEKLAQVFPGDKCLQEQKASRQIGAGPPAYLSIPNFKECLGEHQKPGDTHTERCLPKENPDNCPAESWEKILEVFTGDRCLEQQRQSRQLSLSVLPPMYLSVQGHEACLGTYSPSSTHSEKCLPVSKPAACSDSAWNDLTDVFEGIRCPKVEKVGGPTGLPPAYLSVEGQEKCLDVHQASATHSEKCIPQDQPDGCSEEAWQKLGQVFEGIQCPPLNVGGNQALPPAYLFVDQFEKCLDIYHPTETHSEYCLPQLKLEACDESSWSELLRVFEGIRCPAPQLDAVSANPPHIGVGGQPPGQPGGPSALPPAYLRVEGQEDCLDTHQPTPNYSEKCLPQYQPNACVAKAWRKLTQVFDGIRCSIGEAKTVGGSDSAQPDYLSVEGQQECLGYHQIGDTHTVKCLPTEKPAACDAASWQQLQKVFTGIGCPKDSPDAVAAGKPAYLDVEGHEFCLGTYRASETHTEKCLPRQKLEDCDDSAWEALPKVFTGIRCPAVSVKSTDEPAEVVPAEVDLSLGGGGGGGHSLVDGYQDCIQEQLATENRMEKCLPELKPEGCSETAWSELESTFLGSQCRRQPNALPPHYLSVEGHENCLETHQASESHTEMCMPVSKPEECPIDAWESLQLSFEVKGLIFL